MQRASAVYTRLLTLLRLVEFPVPERKFGRGIKIREFPAAEAGGRGSQSKGEKTKRTIP